MTTAKDTDNRDLREHCKYLEARIEALRSENVFLRAKVAVLEKEKESKRDRWQTLGATEA